MCLFYRRDLRAAAWTEGTRRLSVPTDGRAIPDSRAKKSSPIKASLDLSARARIDQNRKYALTDES